MENGSGFVRAKVTWGDTLKLAGGVAAGLGIIFGMATFFGFRPVDYEARGIEITSIKFQLEANTRAIKELTEQLHAFPHCQCAIHDYESRIKDLERDRFGYRSTPR